MPSGIARMPVSTGTTPTSAASRICRFAERRRPSAPSPRQRPGQRAKAIKPCIINPKRFYSFRAQPQPSTLMATSAAPKLAPKINRPRAKSGEAFHHSATLSTIIPSNAQDIVTRITLRVPKRFTSHAEQRIPLIEQIDEAKQHTAHFSGGDRQISRIAGVRVAQDAISRPGIKKNIKSAHMRNRRAYGMRLRISTRSTIRRKTTLASLCTFVHKSDEACMTCVANDPQRRRRSRRRRWTPLLSTEYMLSCTAKLLPLPGYRWGR